MHVTGYATREHRDCRIAVLHLPSRLEPLTKSADTCSAIATKLDDRFLEA